MDTIAQHLSTNLDGNPKDSIASLLNKLPEHRHLDTLTDFLTQSSGIDERLASFINAAWEWICQNQLWTTRYESLSEYRKAVRYAETIRPIVQRHKRSELAKGSYAQTIRHHWGFHFEQALPEDVRPSIWSKHLLSLISVLSKHRNHSDAIALLRESMGRRPERGRTRHWLIASDVKRALETVNTQRKDSKGRKARGTRNSLSHSLHADSPTDARPSSTTISLDTTDSSEVQTPSVLDENFNQTLSLLSPAVQTSRTRQAREELDWPCCACTPLCLPFIALISTPWANFDEKRLTALIDWAHTVSWGSFCSDHLTRLAQFVPGQNSSVRLEVIQKLEGFRSRRFYRSKIKINASISTRNCCDSTELLCRYTGSADAWWRWQRDGYLHITGFFSYMEELGVFKRIRECLSKIPIQTNDSSLMEHKNCMIKRCYYVLSQMVQRDPAYYAVLVACRPDQNWTLTHNPNQVVPSTTFENEDVAFGVPMDRIKMMVQGKGTSDIQSTIVFPTPESQQIIRLVPGFHRHVNSWLQTSLEMKYGESYARFGEPQDLKVQSGDLIISLPQILRWPKTFSAPNLFNMSQTGLEDGFGTNSPDLAEASITKASRKMRGQSTLQYHDAYDMQRYQCDIDQIWCGSSGELAEALVGRLEWTNGKVIEERTRILGKHGASAVKFVQQTRERLAERFHRVFDSIETGLNPESDPIHPRTREGHGGQHLDHASGPYIAPSPSSFMDLLPQVEHTWDPPSLDEMCFVMNQDCQEYLLRPT